MGTSINLTTTLYGNFGGPKTNRQRLAMVPAVKLWDILLGRRAKGNLAKNIVLNRALIALHQAGLEDPFEERAEIQDYVRNLFDSYQPQTEIEKAILLFRAVIQPLESFKVNGNEYGGLPLEAGGLVIRANYDPNEPLRKKFGAIMPKELIGAPVQERVAMCLEYSHLLVVLLRTVGIKAQTKKEPFHIYVIALLDGIKYKLDAGQLEFESTDNDAGSDRESLAAHYSNKGEPLINQGRYAEAIQACEQALEIRPDDDVAWNNKAIALSKQGNLAEAVIAYDKVLEIDPSLASTWNDKALALDKQGKTAEAIAAYDKALGIDPDYIPALLNKGIMLFRCDNQSGAAECIGRAEKLIKGIPG